MDYSIPAGDLERGGNVFPHVVRGRPVWVKKRRRRDNIWHWRLQRALYAATRILLLLPPAPPPANSVEFEAGRLRRASELGLRVPAVLHQAEDYFVLEDAGPRLEQYARAHPAEAEGMIARAASELRRMHDLGIAHGGAQIKNITVRDGEIFFIDLEEGVPPGRLEQFKLRDLFLFLFSLEKNGMGPDLRRVSSAYGGGDADAVLRRMVGAIRQLRALRIFTSGLFARWSLRDVRAICGLVDRADREHRRMQCLEN